jgi:hypothetical protein
MSAPSLSIFLPSKINGDEVFKLLVSGLHLTVDVWPSDRPSTLASSAQAGPVNSYVLIEHYADSAELIDELLQWERPGERYRRLLSGSAEHLAVTHRDQEKVRTLFDLLANYLGPAGTSCVVENGEGCLLTLADIQACAAGDPLWRWDKQVFPELPEVGISEWLEE